MNPYEVLGITPSATPQEIREAYLALAKKYHPDRYQDSALKKQAEDKMKRINAAYDILTKQQPKYTQTTSQTGSQTSGQTGQQTSGQQTGSYYSTTGTWGWTNSHRHATAEDLGRENNHGNESSRYSGRYAAEFFRVRQLINLGEIETAMKLLNAIPLKNAEWEFLYGMCCYRNGKYSQAYEFISRACRMDPDNTEYAAALNTMRGSTRNTTTWTKSADSLDTAGFCVSVICANILCGLCCGR